MIFLICGPDFFLYFGCIINLPDSMQKMILLGDEAIAQAALDAAGAYSVRLATNRAHSINVAIPGLRTATTVLAGAASFPVTERTVTLGADGTADFNLPAFPSQVRITGKVTDSTGKGVKDVTVSAYSKELSGAADLGYSGSAQTDVNGTYELVLLRGINYEVTFTPQPPTP